MNPSSAAQVNGGLGSAVVGVGTHTAPNAPVQGTGASTGQIKTILVLDDNTQFGQDTVGNMNGLVNSTFSAGTYLFGIWKSVELSSGSAIVYYG